MIRVAVVEDEEKNRDQMKLFLERFSREKDTPLDIAFFSDGMDFVASYRAEYDLIFLDIVMPMLDGMRAARRIRKADETVVIIFITNMAQYAINGYEVGATDYILKPLNYGMFCMKMVNALKAVHRRAEKTITLKQRGGVQKLRVSNIQYIEVDGHYLTYHTSDGEYKALGTLKETQEELQSENFVRCSNYFLINLKYVSGIYGNTVTVAGVGLQISRSRKKELLQAVAAYMGEM